MINRKLFAEQVMRLLEQDTYLRVSFVSSKLMVSKPTTRRLLNAMVKDCILRKQLKLYGGNAYEYLYSRF
jgi:predicted transcriptional regulator